MDDTSAADTAWRVIEQGARHGAYGGAVALVEQGGRTTFRRALGAATFDPAPEPMTPETLFDLASLTKVVATLPALLRLVDAGVLDLDDPLGRSLPEFGQGGRKRGVTVRRLLSHTAGLTAWLPLYLDHQGPDAYLAAIAASQPAHEPGADVVYSDLGFILLGEVVRRLTGRDIAAFAVEEIFAPLGLIETAYLPSPARRARAAATERGNTTEREMCGDRATGFDRWRTGLIRGQVHDGNAWYGLGGVSGHAGLFGTADDLARYGRLWLNGGEGASRRLLSPGLIAEATRRQAPGRGLGWRVQPDDPAERQETSGGALGNRAYGHTGFTGTSLWLDPDRDLVAVLLTNRLYPPPRTEFEPIRRAFHAALVQE